MMKNDGIFALALLATLERYIPYMSEGELMEILDYGIVPDALTIWLWEVRRMDREATIERRFKEAYFRQK